MTVKEFVKRLEDIKKTYGFDSFRFYARMSKDLMPTTRFYIGKHGDAGRFLGYGKDSMKSTSKNLVTIYSNRDGEDWFEEGLYDTVEKIKEAFKRAGVRDSAEINLKIDPLSVWKPKGYKYGGLFSIRKVLVTNPLVENVVIIIVDVIKGCIIAG